CLPCILAKEPANFCNSSFMMAHFSVPETVFRASGKFIQPSVDLLIRFAEEVYGFLTMIFKFGHDDATPILMCLVKRMITGHDLTM
ncbi:MAG: hypothetical protein KKB74_07425, partial [Bacteroidetes bacterium]|nr:hypothetical protein [Bacteroidota bacterium]